MHLLFLQYSNLSIGFSAGLAFVRLRAEAPISKKTRSGRAASPSLRAVLAVDSLAIDAGHVDPISPPGFMAPRVLVGTRRTT
jgi:hypothetical protein